MAGESAREVARRAREKAERLNRRAELFEQGAEGEAATAKVLASLPPGWAALHDVRWPGRRLANVDHVIVGPGGVFVIDSKNWTGRIIVDGGRLRQNGYSREKTVAAAADAALAIAELISPYADYVHPVLCIVGQDRLTGWCREVMVCSTTNLVDMLTTRPVVFTPAQIRHLHWRLHADLWRVSPVPSEQPSEPSRAKATASTPARSRRRSRSSGPSLTRLLVGGAMLLTLITVGPQLVAAIGGTLAEELTKNLETPICSDNQRAEAKLGRSGPDSAERDGGAKAKSGKKAAQQQATGSSGNNPSDPCDAP